MNQSGHDDPRWPLPPWVVPAAILWALLVFVVFWTRLTPLLLVPVGWLVIGFAGWRARRNASHPTPSHPTEEAWRQSQRRLSLCFNQSLDGYYFSELETPQSWDESTEKDRVLEYIRTHQRITEVNDAMLAQYGASRAEFLGRPVGEFFAHDRAQGQRLHRQLCDQGRLHVETCERRQDGTPIWIEGDYVCIYDEQHRITGTFGVQRDITARKQAEEARAQLEEQLRHARKLEAIGQLAGGVAHDFNNILAALMMNVGMLQRSPVLPDSVRVGLEEMDPLLDRAATLVRQLLIFARRGVMNFQTLDLRDLVRHLLQMLGRLIGAHIRLRFPDSPFPLWVRADPGMIEQVVTNLVVNARDALPQGGSIELSLDTVDLDATQVTPPSEARPGTFIRLTVRDDGVGMDAPTQRRMFEPFFTTKEVGKGSGLGLSTVQGIVQQHQGWIEVTSAPGRGSTFQVYLPAAPPPLVDLSPPLNTGPASQLPQGTETILLTEDEASLRSSMTRVLERQGFRVIPASDGLEALQRWREAAPRPDALISDMVMPEGIDGFRLAEQLREEAPELPVILMTGYSAELLKRAPALPPGTSVLQKPINPHDLLGALRRALDSRPLPPRDSKK